MPNEIIERLVDAFGASERGVIKHCADVGFAAGRASVAKASAWSEPSDRELAVAAWATVYGGAPHHPTREQVNAIEGIVRFVRSELSAGGTKEAK